MRILFIGNSHTFFNALPNHVQINGDTLVDAPQAVAANIQQIVADVVLPTL